MTQWEELLDQRRKESELAIYFARQLIEDLGKDKALEILGRAFERHLTDTITKRLEGVPLERRFEQWCERAKQNSQESPGVEIVSCSDKELAMNITRCASYEVFAENGLTEVCQRYCDADFKVAKVIHPNVKLVRTKALAYGDECCNHRWTLEE